MRKKERERGESREREREKRGEVIKQEGWGAAMWHDGPLMWLHRRQQSMARKNNKPWRVDDIVLWLCQVWASRGKEGMHQYYIEEQYLKL